MPKGSCLKSSLKSIRVHIEKIVKATFEKFSEEWLTTYAEVNLKASTFDGYRDIINRLLKPTFGSLPMMEISTGLLQNTLQSERKR